MWVVKLKGTAYPTRIPPLKALELQWSCSVATNKPVGVLGSFQVCMCNCVSVIRASRKKRVCSQWNSLWINKGLKKTKTTKKKKPWLYMHYNTWWTSITHCNTLWTHCACVCVCEEEWMQKLISVFRAALQKRRVCLYCISMETLTELPSTLLHPRMLHTVSWPEQARTPTTGFQEKQRKNWKHNMKILIVIKYVFDQLKLNYNAAFRF